jgi:hypothetical protein
LFRSFCIESISSFWSCLSLVAQYHAVSFPSQDDEFTHLYTLILRSDNTYEVKIDNKRVEGGKLEEDWDFLPPKTIPDPEAKKPEDWDDKPKIDDPEAEKPEVREGEEMGHSPELLRGIPILYEIKSL